MTLRIDRNKSVTANFIKTFTLTLTAINGSITAVPSPSPYDSGTVVNLTPVPSNGYQFGSWSDSVTGSTNPTNITMNSDKIVTANFTIKTYTLTVNYGTGGTTIPAGDNIVSHGLATSITATPEANYHPLDLRVLVGNVDPSPVLDFDGAVLEEDDCPFAVPLNFTDPVFTVEGFARFCQHR